MITALRSYNRVPEAPAAMKKLFVSDFLTEEKILFFPTAVTKRVIFETLIDAMKLDDPALALKEVLYRELWGRTVLAPGLALPHARIAGMTRIEAAIGICPQGVAEPSLADSKKPFIFLLFFGPTSDVQQHLAFLAAVSSLFQTKELPDRLMQLRQPASVLTQICAAEEGPSL